MRFNDYIKEEDIEEKDDVEIVPPEESEMDDGEIEDMESSDDDDDELDMDDEDSEDEEVDNKITDLLPQILSSTFKALQEVIIPVEHFIGQSGLTKEDIQYWADHAPDAYPDLTHSIKIDGDDVVITEVGVEDEDADEIEVDEIEPDDDDESNDDELLSNLVDEDDEDDTEEEK